MDYVAAGDPSTSAPADPSHSCSDPADDRVFLVPYRWWREAQEGTNGKEENPVRGVPYTGTPVTASSYGTKLLNMFSSDQTFCLRRDDSLLGANNEDSNDGGGRGEEGVYVKSYALIGADLWLQAIEWYGNCSSAEKNSVNNSVFFEEDQVDVYPLMLRISVTRETNMLTVKISKKDNSAENYKRASKIFFADSDPIHIWDFSGQTNLILMNEWNQLSHDGCSSDQEIFLEVQVYTLPEVMLDEDGKKDDLMQKSLYGNSSGCNGTNYTSSGGSLKGSALWGLSGLENLGNTCFMNSSIQCLAHTTKLVDYFLDDYSKEINRQNPLGMHGELALAFGDLLRKLWTEKSPIAPRNFKGKLASFAPQFSGFSQHDSQELLAFLLDGLHEDLNRVKIKPYVEAKDADGRPDKEVADEYWQNHLARNDSIIVDICQGQYKSSLLCPVCKKVSVTFDPFMYLTLPLPSTSRRTMTVTVFSTVGTEEPLPCTVSVPKYGDLKNLIDALNSACSLRDDESLLIAEVYNSCIIRYLEEPSDSISLIRDGDQLVAYRIPKDLSNLSVTIFVHQLLEENHFFGKTTTRWKRFGVPLVSCLSETVNGEEIYTQYLKILTPFLKSKDNASDPKQYTDGNGKNSLSDVDPSGFVPERMDSDNYSAKSIFNEDALQFYVTDERFQTQICKIEMNEAPLTRPPKRLHVVVSWQEMELERYNLHNASSLPEVYKPGLSSLRTLESYSLYACLDGFIKEEPLGPEDMWYCPSCKEHRQASKKLDLWRLPEVLIIHLKRFSYNRFLKNKLETFVDFPIHDLDLSNYITHSTELPPYRYRLFAISNHYGNMGGGHYTAYVYHEEFKQWYNFDDRHVSPIPESEIKTSAAYVLFYWRD